MPEKNTQPPNEQKPNRKPERRHVPGKVVPFLVRELAEGLTPGEFKLWMILFLSSNRDGFCRLLNSTLSRKVGRGSLGARALYEQKRRLIKDGWLENLGQRNRGANLYRVKITIPTIVEKFLDELWSQLNSESWWQKLGRDRHKYAEDHLDWLLAWRAIEALRRQGWIVGRKLPEDILKAAIEEMLQTLRAAGKQLNPERGIWWLFGEGFDLAAGISQKE